ncbi:protein WEAK CHLOROPLAST MOVEMENT UNDER BLUE LIGHT-like 3 [Nicotiana tomentosiformis]|uniref:protein WEAK CHLOROPLAST MOVEMENT UNDER BLUE LIGHT-like 3 n=1 Tax=Nicotiana tomentosiformis TaxID=4098 RepID=UPI00388C938F
MKALISSIDKDKDRGWMSRFVRVRTCDIISEEKVSFPEEWNFDRLTKNAILRLSSVKEEIKSPVPKPGEDKKRKTASQSEDPKPKPRRVRRKVITLMMDSVQKLRDEEEEEEENASALMVRPRKVVEVTKPSEPTAAAKIKPHVEEASKKKSGEDPELSKVEIVSRPSATTPDGAGSETPKINQSVPSDLLGTMTAGHLSSLPTFSEEAIGEAQELKNPDIGGGSSVGDPLRDCFTGVDDVSDIGDTSILLEEAQRLLSRAFAKFRADLSQYETKLQRVPEERNSLKLLCGQKDETIKDLQANLAKAHEEEADLDKQQKVEMIELLRGEVDQVKADCDLWKENMDRLAAEKETTLAKLSSVEVQLWGFKEKSSAQAKRIEELETGLVKAKSEIENTKVVADKSVAMYRADAEAAQMQLREASDREQWIIDSTKCQSRRETLEEIHTRGFDLSEEIARAVMLETEARQLTSFDDEDDGEEGSRGRSDEGPEAEVAPEEEVETGRS